MTEERIVILGASKGLGRALAEILMAQGHSLLLFSRNRVCLEELQKKSPKVKIEIANFGAEDEASRILPHIESFQPHRIFYVAGGGPYGKFHEKEWKDHTWALRVNFEFPAKLLHGLLQQKNKFSELKQMIFVGSAVAESKPDANAAAYSAAKHALIGLVSSVRAENPSIDVRVFSPSYMDTEMLPANAWPRQKGLAENPALIAEKLNAWSMSDDAKGHLVLGSGNH